MELINKKHYPLWSQFVDLKEEWIGGTLQDIEYQDDPMGTKIIDIFLTPNGDDSAYFKIIGEKFDCGFDVQHGGISAGDEGYITFVGSYGLHFRIKKADK